MDSVYLVYGHSAPGSELRLLPHAIAGPKAPLAGASLVESTYIGGPGQPHPPLLLSDRGRKWGPIPLGSIEQIKDGTSGECASSVSRAGGTPGWLLNLCSGTWS